ncbi:MAG TPA: type II toxin-antitoxin system HicB family antitoxin [Steroidobacteraceae bacterium]|nr:type II toxin-antitoxin system HicB family antitoxin [Steroidobacteraceae bacterium]
MIAVADLLEQAGWGRPAASPPRQLRQVVLIHGADDYWVAECPSLPGCVSEGPSRDAAIANARAAIAEHLAALRQAGRPAPPERYETLLLVLSV